MQKLSQYNSGYYKLKNIPPQNRKAFLKQMMAIPQDSTKIPNPISSSYDRYSFFISQNHNKLVTYQIQCKQPKALFVLFHGLNSYIGTSAKMAQYLKEYDIACFGFDQQGFGRSQGQKGVIISAQSTINDGIRYIKNLKQIYKGVKCFIGGLSYGGAISFQIAIKQPDLISGVILFAPAIKDNQQNSPFGKFLVRLLNCCCSNIKTVSQTFDKGYKYQCTKQYIMQDEFIYKDKVIPGSIYKVLELMQSTLSRYEKLKSPYLNIIGTADKMIDPFLGIQLQSRSTSPDKQTIIIQKLWHSIWIQQQIQYIKIIIRQWIQKRL